MDLDEWELLDSHQDIHGGKNDISRTPNPKIVIDMNYFPSNLIEPINFDQKFGEIPVDKKEVLEDHIKSQVFFKKLKENDFVGTLQFEEKDGNFEEETETIKKEKKSNLKLNDEEVNWENNNGGLNILKWAMTGIGAVFSFGFAAATISLIVLGNRKKEQNHQKSKELHFQIYTHEKRMKQVVHHAKKLNEAITAVRGAPLTRAHITNCGYYEGL